MIELKFIELTALFIDSIFKKTKPRLISNISYKIKTFDVFIFMMSSKQSNALFWIIVDLIQIKEIQYPSIWRMSIPYMNLIICDNAMYIFLAFLFETYVL